MSKDYSKFEDNSIGSALIRTEKLLLKEELIFEYFPNTEQLYGPSEKLGKLGGDTGRMIQEFFDELRMVPRMRIKNCFKGTCFILLFITVSYLISQFVYM